MHRLLSDDVDLIQRLARINSGTHNKKGVNEVGEYIVREFLSLGLRCHRYTHKTFGSLFYLDTDSSNLNKRRVLISGHLDTVYEPEAGFNTIKATSRQIWGPGVNDMKGGLVIALRALKNVRDITGTLSNIGVLLSPDEELGSQAHRAQMQRIAQDYNVALVLEGVGKHWELCDQRKGVAMIQLMTYGEAGHSGHWGNRRTNAIDILAHTIIDVVSFADLSRGTSINTGTVSGGSKINIVADSAQANFDMRYTQADEIQRVEKALAEVVHKYNAKCVFSLLMPPMYPNRDTHAVKQAIEKAGLRIGRKVAFEARGSASDGNLFADYGLAVIDGFGCKGFDHHTLKERAVTSSIVTQADLLSATLLELIA
jgi:glutamate carboxypeptidase